ncbi:hypothetical protein JOC55_002721 [Paenibacillus sacheonensis]|nr:hypothetical protein [Paenibacillus sacheonensis]
MKSWADAIVRLDLQDREGPKDLPDLQRKDRNYFNNLQEQSEQPDLQGLREHLGQRAWQDLPEL